MKAHLRKLAIAFAVGFTAIGGVWAGLESATYINGLVATNPTAADPVSQADDHMRLLKSTIKATFPNVSGVVSPTHTQLNMAAGPAFSAYKNAEQSVTSGVATKVTFTEEDFDTAAAYTSSRWTPGVAGYYEITANVLASTTGAATVVLVEVYKNGTTYARGFQSVDGDSSILAAPVTVRMELDADDYVEIYANVTGTSPKFLGQASVPRFSHFSGAMIRAL